MRSAREERRRARHLAVGSDRTDRTDRPTLAVIGLILAGLGVAGLLLNLGALDWRSPASLFRHSSRWVSDRPTWITAAAVATGVLLVVVGLWWAWRQIRRPRQDARLSTTLIPRLGRGRTSIEPAALAKAAGRDMATTDGVTKARVRLTELGSVTQLVAVVDVEVDRDLRQVAAALEQPLSRLAESIGSDATDAELRFRFTSDTKSARVS